MDIGFPLASNNLLEQNLAGTMPMPTPPDADGEDPLKPLNLKEKPTRQTAVAVNQRLVRGFQQNDRFTTGNWIVMTLGVLTIGLCVISYMILKPLLDQMATMGFDPSMAPPGYQF